MKPKYILWGKVMKGKKRGKLLGFPTANFPLHKKIPEGIYISQTKILNKVYKSATFVGAPKTYGEKDVRCETYILNFSSIIYGKWISVRLFKKIRDNKSFESEEKLVEQIKKDIDEIKNYFAQETKQN